MGVADGDGKKAGIGGVAQAHWVPLNKSNDGESLLSEDMVFNDSHVVSISVYSVLMIVSVIGNITVLYLLMKRRRSGRGSRLDFLLMNLAIADLLVAMLMMPMEIGWAATVHWRAGDAMCRIMSFTRTFGLYLSSFVLVCISLDRYYAVLHPLCVSGERRARLALFISWIAAFFSSLPQSFIFHEEAHPNVSWYLQCVSYGAMETKAQERGYFAFNVLLMYLLPLAATVYCYGSILLEIKRRSCQDGKVRRNGVGVFGRARVRTLKMTITIVLVFFVCWTPYYIMCFWYEIEPKSAKDVDSVVQRSLFLFACINSCANPIVYGVYNIRKLKDTYRPGHSSSGFQRNQSRLSYGDSMEMSASVLARARDAHAQEQARERTQGNGLTLIKKQPTSDISNRKSVLLTKF